MSDRNDQRNVLLFVIRCRCCLFCVGVDVVVATAQEYIVPDVRDREFLLTLHRQAEKRSLNIDRYNELRDKIRLTQYDLERLRDPLQLHLPAEYLSTLSTRVTY